MKRYPFIALFKAEHYKTKNNIAVLLFLLAPFAATLIGYAMNIGYTTDYPTNPWTNLIGRKLVILYLFYPMLISIFTYSLFDMEYRNNNLRRLFTSPFSVNNIFAAKILFLTEIIFFSTLIAYLSFISGGFVSSYLSPELLFQDYDIRLACFYLHVRLLTGLLTVSFIQFFLSITVRNFVIPIGFGSFMTIFSFISNVIPSMKEYNHLNPYFAILNSINDFINYQSVSFEKNDYVCLVYLFVFLLVNLFTFKFRKYK